MRGQKIDTLAKTITLQAPTRGRAVPALGGKIERGSIANASECYRLVGHICKNFGITPAKLVQIDTKTATNFLLGIISHFESKCNAGTNIEKYVMALKS